VSSREIGVGLESHPSQNQRGVIDLTTDANGDGIPDQLAEEVARIPQAEDREGAIADLVDRLPYSQETRRLQRKARRLQALVAQAVDQTEAEEINERLKSLSDQMLLDPNYAATARGLASILGLDLSEPNAPAGSDVSGQSVSPQSVSWAGLQPGHIMLVRSGYWPWTAFLYVMQYTHAGNYHGNGLVFESVRDGVRLNPLSNWRSSNQYVALGYNNRRSAQAVVNAMNSAEQRYGTTGRTPYNFYFWDKWTDSRLYCSQLTWKIHKQLGDDLDSNAWQYILYVSTLWGGWLASAIAIPAVAPDEIALSPYVTFYTRGWN